MTGGDRIGRYRLEDVVGVGSFATVHRAVDDWLEDTVALKVLAENHSLNPEVRERFIAEGRNLRRINSPHVVAVHDIGESERQQPFLVLQHADRGTLAERVRRLRATGWTATTADLLVVARGLAAAVEAVHEAQLVHRDLSPGNVLLTSAPGDPEPTPDTTGASAVRGDERLVLADLGMCKDLALNSGLTVAAGTSGFRPPEQVGAGLVDTRADLWSLSALLAWLAEGSDVPPALTGVLARGRSISPDDRHPDVRSWLADVEQALQPPPRPAARPTRPPAEAGRPRRRRLAILLASVLAALAVGVVGGLLVGPPDEPPSRTSLASVAIDGPTRVTVGQEVTFTASVSGLESWIWTLPSGRYVPDLASVTITAQSPGPSHLTLRGQDADGREIETVHELTVTE
ncbi:MAG: protein kinase [Acidobacteria bacterium]|nr:MAG: protein kinase [Acidobacteriota bacterium]